MASYISAKKKELYVDACSQCGKSSEIVSCIRDDNGKLQDYCKECFEVATGKKVSKR